MKTLLLMFVVAMIFPHILFAQYTTQGKIEFERKVNIYAQMEDDDNDNWKDYVKSNMPKFRLTNFDLFFDTSKSIYKPQKEADDKTFSWLDGPATGNIVMTDFTAQQVKANKFIFEQTFVVKDTMRKIQWKVMDEIRTIADYKCRKAVGKICDSVYIVAFYTDDIMVSGGPEMFSGLPGMIMELAVPRLHTTWTATKVEAIPPKPEDFTVSDKGKQVTQKELYESLKNSFSDWGKSAAKYIWWSML